MTQNFSQTKAEISQWLDKYGMGFLYSPFQYNRCTKKLVVGFILSLSAFLTHAQAYICGSGPGPGERQVGMTPGSNGVARMPLCVSQGGGSQSQVPSFDPSFRIPDWLVMRGAEMPKLQRIEGEKELDRMKNGGSWRIYQEGELPIPGQKCNATWVSIGGTITLGTVGSFHDPALLIYTSPKIPKSETPTPQTFRINENGKEMDVQGMLYTFPNASVSSVVIGLQSLNAVIGVMKDSGRVQVEVGAQEVVDISWKDALDMTKKLEQCGKP